MDRRFTTKDGAQHRVVHAEVWDETSTSIEKATLRFACDDGWIGPSAVAKRGYEAEDDGRLHTYYLCPGCYPPESYTVEGGS